MGWVSGLARVVPGLRHVFLGRTGAGAGWFVAFALAVNFGLLAPLAWPGKRARAVRAALGGVALCVFAASHRRASRLEEAERRAARAAARARDVEAQSPDMIPGQGLPARKSC
jgi:hypothetical protein